MKANASSNYRKTRAALVRRGFTIRSWARAHSFPVTTVYGALRGERAGIKAVAVQQQLQAFLKG